MSNNPVCEFVPSYLALTNIKTGIADYYKIEEIIYSYLKQKRIQFSFDSDFCAFRCVQIYDIDDKRIDGVTIYWDDETKQHVVEVRRLRGDTTFHCSLTIGFHNIYNELEELFKKLDRESQTQT